MKALKIAALIGAVVVVGGLTAAYFSLNALVKKAVETVGPEVTKTSLSVSRVGLLPLAGSGSIHGFVLGNPAGFRSPQAMSVGKVHISVEPKSLLSDVIVVREVEVRSPEIWVEGTPTENNLTRIQRNAEAFAGPAKPAKGPAAPAKKVIIDDFLVTGAKLHLAMKLIPETTIPMPDIHLTGIGRKTNGATIGEAAKQMFGSLNGGIAQAATQAVKDVAKNAMDIGKNAAGMGKNMAKQGADLTKNLGGLFGKKKK
jgi:hypothetical protein